MSRTAVVTFAMLGMVAGCVLAGCAQTPSAPPEPVFKDSLQTATATVESAEPVTRLIALRTADGERMWVQAGPEVRNFNQIKAGDKVVVSYYKAIAAQVKPKGSARTVPQETVGAATARPGARPAAAMGRTVVETVKVEKIDTGANTVTFQRADGSVHTATVTSAEGQAFIKGLHSGDDVDVAYSEAVAVAVVPAG